MNIGINASFLRKPGTGIGQVTANFLRTLAVNTEHRIPNTEKKEFFLYVEEEPNLGFVPPEHFHIRVVRPWWGRDDLIRKMLWERFQLPYAARRDQCDVFWSLYQSPVSFHSAIPNFFLAGRQARHAINHTMLVHDIIPKIFPEYLGNWRKRLSWAMTERGIAGADKIVSVSEATKRDLVSMLGIPEGRIAVAYPGLSPVFEREYSDGEVDETLVRYGLKRGGYIYHGGGLEARKNAEGLLRAYAELTSKRNEILPLVISGTIHSRSNPLATDVRGLVQELGLEEKVMLLGFVPEEDLPALYRGAILFVYPSKYEGFGLPALEAMRMGTPVLTARNSSLLEVGGEAVEYFDGEKEGELGAKIANLSSDSARREELSRKGRERAASFSYDALVTAFIETL